MLILRYAQSARLDIEDIADYMALKNPLIAHKILKLIETKCQALKVQPGLGRVGRIEGTRELILADYPYILVYQYDNESLVLLNVVHSRMSFPK